QCYMSFAGFQKTRSWDCHGLALLPGKNTKLLLYLCKKKKKKKKRKGVCFSGKRVRLFHFLFELLEDPTMAHCLSWVPATSGVFCFSSTNKDQVATLWGQRKGNKRPMTYQKMSRALRNYARSGEILKVKKKLTYQFSQDTLFSLLMDPLTRKPSK
uniref:Transcription factor Spi-C n=1 Tax=Neogobius melanostomus TaxID=47308 RepID=A0A8C6T760_9GOBI